MAINCGAFNEFLFRRLPDWDKELAKDRFPFSYIYSNMYTQKQWPAFTGTTHTWDRVHVTRPNDNGCWDVMDATACVGAPCQPTRLYTGWGSTRNTYVKYHRDYQTPVWCFDQLRHIEEAVAQLSAIVEGHKELPESIVSDFLRLLSMRQADVLHIAGQNLTTVAVTDATFSADCTTIDLGSDANLPTSKVNMGYLDNHVENLQYQGYFNKKFTPDGMFAITSDIQTHRDLTVQNPTLALSLAGADYSKGGQYFQYGWMMKSIGNWVFKLDPEPARFQRNTAGKLQRVWPYQNVAATVGKKPQFDTGYKNAQYQMYHVYNTAARDVYVGDLTPVNPDMSFNVSRNLLGKWAWKNPDYFTATDPSTGQVCSYQNDKKNMGYFLAEFELGAKTIYPEIEMIILAQREPQAVINTPNCAAPYNTDYQTQLYPYNPNPCTA